MAHTAHRKPPAAYCQKKVLSAEIELGERYNVLEKIGEGSFGDIYKAFDKKRNQLVAVKLERKDKKGPQGMLMKEAEILRELGDKDSFPRVVEVCERDDFNFIVMSYLGSNMEALKRRCEGGISVQSVMMAGVEMVHSLQNVHELNYIHRDIKPENFVIGNDGCHHIVYLLDFGLSKKYIDDLNRHIPFVENKGLVGTARYTSINSHLGTEQSRRDDLESLGYVLLYFAKGSLPWQNFQCESRSEKFRMIMEKKVSLGIDELCASLPPEFALYFKHVKNLKFTDIPDYLYLKQLFIGGVERIRKALAIDACCFDWCARTCTLDYAPFFERENFHDFRKEDLDEHKAGEDEITVPALHIEESVSLAALNRTLYQSMSVREAHTTQSLGNFNGVFIRDSLATDRLNTLDVDIEMMLTQNCVANGANGIEPYMSLELQQQQQLYEEELRTSPVLQPHRRFKTTAAEAEDDTLSPPLTTTMMQRFNTSDDWSEMQEEDVVVKEIFASPPVKLNRRAHSAIETLTPTNLAAKFENTVSPPPTALHNVSKSASDATEIFETETNNP